MSFGSKKTSLITILSSEHGRLRREQRDIDKRDLQKALKHGTRERAWGQRWKVEYDGISFITDPSTRREVTAFPSPLPNVPTNMDMISESMKTKLLLEQRPDLATSHTVIVIDNSGSMLSKKNDIYLYRDSQNAAFSFTALEFVAEQIFNNTAVNSDLVSLIKFSDKPSVELKREPINWLVYNKILAHRNTEKFVDRKNAPYHDMIFGQSNFLPALKKARELLQEYHHDQLALSMYFFSDGQASDSNRIQQMKDVVSEMAEEFKETLTVNTVGLGNQYDDFTALLAIADAAKSAGAKGAFERCDHTANSISSSISSLVTSTTETRLALQEGRRKGYTQRTDLVSEKETSVKTNWEFFRIDEHFIYNPTSKKFQISSWLPLAVAFSPETKQRDEERKPNPPHLAINRNYLGKGAERVAFRCRLSELDNPHGFVLGEMIAKETKDIERFAEKRDFHEGFAQTQDFANYLAAQFNKHLHGIPSYSQTKTPQLRFLSCSVLMLADSAASGGYRAVLVEKKLDTERFQWTKWNDNNGMVDGERRHMHIDVDFELKQLQKEEAQDLGAIAEGDEDSEEESVSDVESMQDYEHEDAEVHQNPFQDINPSDYLQAFTHFTYRFTNKRVMVCDLQGVFNTDMVPPTIELTDPAIHYASSKGRRMVYGRTDKGKTGMNTFFKTHKCTKICKYLQLSARNKKWQNDWRQESARGMNFHM
ncbi:hypothetical protein ACHAXN_007945 [Cyclotella atomus]